MRLTRRNARFVIPLLGVVAILIILLLAPSTSDRVATSGQGGEGVEAEGQIWTCSMHPQVRQPGPGKCPICGMDLIPVEAEPGAEAAGERTLVVSEAGKKLMEIATSPVERRPVDVEVRLVGRVGYDEGNVSRITAWVPGRIERMHVDYTGAVVEAGQPMADLYGPSLLAAQEELLQSRDAVDRAERADASEAVRAARATLEAVRDRLRLWGLSDGQIAEIEERGTVEPTITILAPTSGTVIEKNATEGMYVAIGSPIYLIADLSTVWVELEAYESDLAWIREGQEVVFTTEAHPGETFHGEVSFVDPVVDPTTRTVRVRVEAGNEDGRLKPEMFVRAVAYAHAGHGERAPLVIPRTAPLLTGARAVVYVEVPGSDSPTYEGREVVLGPRAGDYYVVREGLSEGERVVTEGSFKIDSALQIRAKRSMMSPD